MRRLYDAWRFYSPLPFSFLLDLPRLITPASLAYFKEQLKGLIKQLDRHFGVNVTDESLAQATAESNATRDLLTRLLSLQNRGKPPLRHADILDILASGFRNARKMFNAALDTLVCSLEKTEAQPSGALKVMVSGSVLDNSALIRTVEELGGEVVASDLCVGGRLLDRVTPSSDPLTDLSEAYLKKRPCARMADTAGRVSLLKEDVRGSGALGMIYFCLKFCDTYLYEAPAVVDALNRMDVPVLFIEGEYVGKISGGLRTRVQAFLEMLERRNT
jgi:benzoyl-CoA reductase/2-hydroxyglutaryl-CoA dehydratase subunit BcrC/BadD/HgdB